MTQPTAPTILELPRPIARNFYARFPIEDAENPSPATDSVDILADHDTAEYILHLSPGASLPITDQTGRARNLRLTDTIPSSIFQSELLMQSRDFSQLFPNQSGFSTVLITCPPEDEKPLTQLLESQLAPYSVTIEPTAARIARYQKVANTYLITFQALGSLGLLLGTVGVAVVLLRSVYERRAEFALLSALGHTPLQLLRLVFTEHATLLTAGVFIGTASALLAVLPAARNINLQNLSLILSLILAIGLCLIFLSTRLSTRRLTPATLRSL